MSACCGDPACSHSLFAAATSEATKLTDKEREIILGVLGRDELIRRRQQHQVTHLKAELQNLRRKGALRPSTDWDSTGPDPDRSCGRCRVELGRVINRGAYCRACRLKVCKSCREYSYRTTEWVCTVCHKHMEIQAASGEWMNEFVRRPSRRRDTRVYQPAADIIKRTIRRSWTISNPTPRWNALRSSPERRAYSSLPRGQDINNYPALAIHQTITKNEEFKKSPNLPRSAARRTLSEDVYCEENPPLNNPSPKASPKAQPRINPLIKYAEKPAKSKSPSRMPKNPSSEKTPNRTITKHVSFDNNSPTPISTKNNVLRTKSLNESKHKMPSDNKGSVKTFGEAKKFLNETRDTSLSKPSEGASNLNPSDNGRQVNVHHEAPPDSVKEVTAADVHFAKEEAAPVELCDIEPFSGTVFRKVTVRRRRNNSMRKISGCVEASGWRRGPDSDLLDILLPEGDDYKLVFISSDSSSKEDIDDNDSSSTASSFPIEDGDWDYFEPGTSKGPAVLNWASPFGSPSVYRKSAIESPIGSPIVYRRTRESDTGTDDDITRLDSGSPTSSDSFITSTKRFDDNMELKSDRMEDVAFPCKHQPSRDMQQKPPCHSCGAPTQYIPIPVPVPIPFPVPTLWTQEALKLYGAQPALEQSFNSRLRALPRNLWPYMNNSGLIWPLISAGDHGALQSLLSSADGSIPLATDHDAVVMQPAISTDDQQQQFEHEIALEEKASSEKNAVCDLPADEVMFGYLECENTYASSSSDSDISGEDENDCDKPRTMRMYNVNEGNSRESDDALPSSNATSCDEEDGGRHSQSSVKEDDMSSTGSNETDTDDTGTVADKKTKKFSKIFVVNKNISSSSEHLTSSDTDSDTSDNNTDTELDCTVILTNMTPLHESNSADKTNENLNNTLENRDLNESLIKPVKTEIKLPICANEEYTSSSPGLSDVSAESLNSNESEFSNNAEVNPKKHTFEQRDNMINKSEIKKETLDEKAPSLICSEWNVAGEEIRSSEPVSKVGERETTRDHGAQAGVLSAATLVTGETPDIGVSRHAAPYKTRVMITQDSAPQYDQVSVVTSDTTTVVPTENNDVVVQHTNWQNENKNNSSGHNPANENSSTLDQQSVKIITGEKTLSAFEEGLADDDSWVENLSHDDDFDEENSVTEDSSSGDEVTLTCSAVVDQEDVLRGYHRGAIDFTLHTIVEESCEESEVEQFTKNKKARPTSATDLEKYFFFGLGDGANATSSINTNREDAFSDTSSIYSESMDSMGGPEETQQSADNSDPAELASSRLEKYFLSGFMGFTGQRRDSDGSVGSDSEGRPSPEQRRKKLVRARGTGRSHSSSLDNLLANPDLSNNEQSADNQNNSASASSSDTDTFDETITFEKSDGQFDTVKRKKNKKQKSGSYEEIKSLETTQEVNETKTSDEENDGQRTPQPESNLTTAKNQQSRDSGFVGSCDDLLKEQREVASSDLSNQKDAKPDLEDIIEEKKAEEKPKTLGPPVTSLTRKDSFNNWSSDEETNLMMCKMRQFFKTMVANTAQTQSTPSTPTLSARVSPKPVPSPRMKHRSKPPQLVYFENELTRLMKTVPGIREDQVREIVEYLSSEDTWSDSYDSSDYTSSDLECANTKSALQQQISDSCKQIINKFDKDEEGDEGDGGIVDESQGLNRETAFVYQKLVASFEKMATGDNTETKVPNSPKDSPPLIAKVMHHIGSRLVALMHEVSSGESHASNSPKVRHYHKRLQHKISSASTTTTEDDESTSDSNLHDTLSALDVNFSSYNMLSRSRSHDLLVGEAKMQHHQSSGGVSDIAEEREASDCERFSWRGSFESALLASDSRTKLSLLSGENSASASALAIAAKRRSAGDLLFNHKSFSREQLDRVRSCGSIGGANSEDKLWVSTNRPNRRRSSVPDATCGSGGSADGEDDDEDEEIESRATLPRSLQSAVATTNSLPRLPTNNPPSGVMSKAQSMHHFLQQNAKSARYRPPGFSKVNPTVPKRAVSAPGLQPTHQRRSRRSQQHIPSDDVSSISEAHSSPMLASRNSSNCPTPSPGRTRSRKGTSGSISSQEWHNNEDEHVSDRMVVMQTRSSLSSLGFRSDSMASVYSGAGEGRYGSVTVRGQVEFGLQYNYKAGDLEINIKQCKDLAPVDTKRNRSDPYVKVYLLPDKSKSGKRKTKVKKHTLNPVFDEIIKFHISLNGLETRTLWLTVWHSDIFGRNDFLGEVMMTLENKVFDDPAPKCYTLQERTEPFDDMISFKGDIIVCLKFVPPDMTVHKKGKRSRGTLHVLVKEAKCLTAYKANGTSDPFCKSYLLPEKGRNSKQKTPVAKKTINPSWNHTFVYDDVTLQELAERCLELTVWDHDRLASNEFLGGVRFSLGSGKHYGKPVEWMDASGKELTLWKSMLERPNFWVEGCLSLRPTLESRIS